MAAKNTKKETVMVLCAHPDDEILGPGGTIARYAQEGKEVIAVIYSYGEGGNWWLKKGYTQDLRVKESSRAGEIIGISGTVYLGLKDLSLKQEIENPEVLDQIEEVIKEYGPMRIFTHSEDDIVYPDHKAVHDSVVTVLKRMKYKGDVYAFNIWGKDIRATK
ncbi:PIG-L deacetylase family protein, partial [Thermoproteota archaeon]